MIDKITAGIVVAGVVGVLFGAIFDATFLRPLQDSVFLKETAHPSARYITPVQLGCLTRPHTDIPEFADNVVSVCIKGISATRTPQATQ
jgi:hypothetical protein